MISSQPAHFEGKLTQPYPFIWVLSHSTMGTQGCGLLQILGCFSH